VEKYGNAFTALMGAEAVRELLETLDLTNWPSSCARNSTRPAASRRSRTSPSG
jgi:hypothetical protein